MVSTICIVLFDRREALHASPTPRSDSIDISRKPFYTLVSSFVTPMDIISPEDLAMLEHTKFFKEL